MNSNPTPAKPIRYAELVSLRGLAALTVMLGPISDFWLKGTQPDPKACHYFLAPFTFGEYSSVMLSLS